MGDKPLVLIVEDEPLLTHEFEDTLIEAGYEVLVATNGDEAIVAIDQHGDALDGLVTDINWKTGPNGWAVAKAARKAHHSIPVVFMTGDSAADWAVEGVPKSVMLQKPFAPSQLTTALANLINDQDSSLE